MKRIIFILTYTILLGMTNYSYADYPIVGYRYIADPGALVYNGRVYVYCSNDDDNEPNGDAYDMHSIVCISSSDLKNWTDHGVVFTVPENASWSGKSWAPSPVYRNGKFYLYFGNGGSAIGVAVSDSPTGTFVDPLDKALVTGSTAGVQPFDGWLFDPMTFIDDDGQAYMYFGGNGDDNLRVIKLNEDMISVNGSAGSFTVDNFFEAAWVHKYNGTYYFSYSSNPSAGMRIDYMTSSSPMSGFTYGGIVSLQPPSNYNNNHQAIIEFNGEWYQLYHNRIVATNAGVSTGYRRNMAIDKFTHASDGSINQMVNTVDGVQQIKYLDPFVRVEAETMSNHNGIETEVCSAGGMNVAYIDNGDWTMVEGVDFGSAGASTFSASVASPTGGAIQIRLDNPTGTLAGTLQVPNTGDYQTWQTETASLNRITGVHNIYFVYSTGGFNFDHWIFYSNGPIVNITAPLSSDVIFAGDEITISATATPQVGTITKVDFYVNDERIVEKYISPYVWNVADLVAGTYTIKAVAFDSNGNTSEDSRTITVNIPQSPYGGIAHAIPGTIEFEEYDVGGNGFAYQDDSPDNTGSADFRMDEDVDIENCTDTGAGYNIGYCAADEWLEYTVDVKNTGAYDIDIRLAADGDGRTISLASDNTDIATDITIPNTGGWQVWQTVTVNDVNMTAGIHVIKVTIGSVDYVNLNYITFTATSVAPTVNITSPAEGSEFDASQKITLEATATSTTSTIANVSFFANDELIGTDNSSPYAFKWSGMPAGEYEISAVATDADGLSSEDIITINISEAPVTISLKKGWNCIGYPYITSADLETALSGIWEYVEIVKDFDGYYDSSQNPALNSLSTLNWGEGYFIQVNSNCELIWSE